MKPIHQTLLRLVAITSASWFVSAQDFAIEPLGPALGSGVSTDGNFAVSGVMTPMSGPVLNGGDFAVTGDFRVFSPDDPLLGDELIVNGSFENATGTFVPDGNGAMVLFPGSQLIPGWRTTTAGLAWVVSPNVYGLQTPFGSHSLDLTGYSDAFSDARPYGGVAQTIPTLPGQTYRLSLALSSKGGGQKTVSVCAVSGGTVFTIPFFATGTSWKTFSFRFVADSESTVISINGLVASGYYLGLDNVSVRADYGSPLPGAGDLVVNGNFESTCPGDFSPDARGGVSLQSGSTSLPGWTVTAAEILWNFNFGPFSPGTIHGELFLDLTGIHDSPPYGGITQTLATTPNQSYQLTFALGTFEDSSLARGPVTVSVEAGTAMDTFTFTPEGEGNQWKTFTMNFTADSTSTPLTFRGTASAGGSYLGLDQVSVLAGNGSTGVSVAAAAVAGDSLQLSFTSVAGKAYLLESREELATGGWKTVPGTVSVGTGGTLEIQVPGVFDQPQSFFRVRELP